MSLGTLMPPALRRRLSGHGVRPVETPAVEATTTTSAPPVHPFEAHVLRHCTAVTPELNADQLIDANERLHSLTDPIAKAALARKIRHATLDLRCGMRIDLRGFLGETKPVRGS